MLESERHAFYLHPVRMGTTRHFEPLPDIVICPTRVNEEELSAPGLAEHVREFERTTFALPYPSRPQAAVQHDSRGPHFFELAIRMYLANEALLDGPKPFQESQRCDWELPRSRRFEISSEWTPL